VGGRERREGVKNRGREGRSQRREKEGRGKGGQETNLVEVENQVKLANVFETSVEGFDEDLLAGEGEGGGSRREKVVSLSSSPFIPSRSLRINDGSHLRPRCTLRRERLRRTPCARALALRHPHPVVTKRSRKKARERREETHLNEIQDAQLRLALVDDHSKV